MHIIVLLMNFDNLNTSLESSKMCLSVVEVNLEEFKAEFNCLKAFTLKKDNLHVV